MTTAGASQLPLFHILGFTGHRQITHPQVIIRAIGEALDFLKSETPGEWVVLSSVAEGGDQLFVRQALQRGLSWHAILPLPAHRVCARLRAGTVAGSEGAAGQGRAPAGQQRR